MVLGLGRTAASPIFGLTPTDHSRSQEGYANNSLYERFGTSRASVTAPKVEYVALRQSFVFLADFPRTVSFFEGFARA